MQFGVERLALRVKLDHAKALHSRCQKLQRCFTAGPQLPGIGFFTRLEPELKAVTNVQQLSAETDCEPIDIIARLSDRVPFGTGAAVGKLMELENPKKEFLLYHPTVFSLLGSWLGSLPAFWQSRSSDVDAILSQPALINGLEEQGATRALQHALRQSSDAGQFNRQMHTWFDAFRTRKLIHYLRDHHLPSISYAALVAEHNHDHLFRHESTLPGLHQILVKDNHG